MFLSHRSVLSFTKKKPHRSWLSISDNGSTCWLTEVQQNWLQIDQLSHWSLILTGLTLSSRGMPLLCTAWNCSWLNSVAILSRIWPANKGLYTHTHTHILKCKYLNCYGLVNNLTTFCDARWVCSCDSHLLISRELDSLEFCEWRIFSIFSTERTTWISLNTHTWWMVTTVRYEIIPTRSNATQNDQSQSNKRGGRGKPSFSADLPVWTAGCLWPESLHWHTTADSATHNNHQHA